MVELLAEGQTEVTGLVEGRNLLGFYSQPVSWGKKPLTLEVPLAGRRTPQAWA